MFTITPMRTRWLRSATVVVFLGAISYTILLDLDVSQIYGDRRQLDYLDSRPSAALRYGRATIDQNFQALLQPSAIESSLFRATGGAARDRGHADDASACDRVLLFLPQSFASHGHGSQLNSYLLAALVATFADRAMVVLEPPPSMNEFSSNSQFGCPPEAWATQKFRSDAPAKRVGWTDGFPNGLTRLIKHPPWLSRRCPVPCPASHDYEQWDEVRRGNNITVLPAPREVTCANADGRPVNVVALGGRQVRDYFDAHYRYLMLAGTVAGDACWNRAWALRLGARPDEACVYPWLRGRNDLWDHMSAFLARAGLLRFQPWIARDVEAYVRRLDLPLDAPYDAVHVRRGDQLNQTKAHVLDYWRGVGRYDNATGGVPHPYIPFAHYLRQFDEVPCSATPRLVYVATDDPAEVQNEIRELPTDAEGHAFLPGAAACHKFRFFFGKFNQSLGFHLKQRKRKGDCDERYARNVASIADLTLLAKSDVFVGEFHSNWGRLVRTFRLRTTGAAARARGAGPVTLKEVKVAWGSKNPLPPGW